MSGDWADERARKWCQQMGVDTWAIGPRLAALLREVESEEHACGDHIKARLDEQMAEVRRVVAGELAEENGEHTASCLRRCGCASRILRRLEAL